MNEIFISDYERFTPNKYRIWACIIRLIRNHELRYIYWGRVFQNSRIKIVKSLSSVILHGFRRKYGLEINFGNVGGGIRLIHPWQITINANAYLGENVTLYKGVTIGEIEGGVKAGNPTIGDNVTICANATVCGKIFIGKNTWIAAGAFVNFDVPENSLVIGNPGRIHKRHF